MAHVEEVHSIVHEHVAGTPEINVKAGKKVSYKKKINTQRWSVRWLKLECDSTMSVTYENPPALSARQEKVL